MHWKYWITGHVPLWLVIGTLALGYFSSKLFIWMVRRER